MMTKLSMLVRLEINKQPAMVKYMISGVLEKNHIKLTVCIIKLYTV